MPGILQEDIAVLKSSSALIVLHQNTIGPTQVTHSLRKHFLRLWGTRSVLSFKVPRRQKSKKVLFSPMHNEGPKL